MLVSQLLKEKGVAVHAISPHESMAQACETLTRLRIGALMVCEEGEVVGVLSERDIVRAVSQDGAGALERPASHYMTTAVIFAQPHETTADLMARMTDRRIRHLPVREQGELAGVVSIGDVVKSFVAEISVEAETLRRYIAG
jgi:CBS domain-containing protein